MRKPQISLCMIVKNEEDVIARCLQSAKNAVDEIIVVDSGSTDRTAAIALSEGAAVHHRPWRHDFSAARNESIALAAGDWILVLDADETLEEGHGALLREMMERSPEADGFLCKLSTMSVRKASIRDRPCLLPCGFSATCRAIVTQAAFMNKSFSRS